MVDFVVAGPWEENEVEAGWAAGTRPTIAELEREIEDAWAKKRAVLGDRLFDGEMCRLERWRVEGGKLRLTLSRTNYKPFFGTNLSDARGIAAKYGRVALANGVGMSLALETGDRHLVMGRRNDRVAYYPNHIHPFAGALEPRDVPRVFDGVRRELKEELQMDPDEAQSLRLLAVIEDRALLQPELIFAARTHLTLRDLEGRLEEDEHDAIWAVRSSKDSLDRVLNEINSEGATPAGDHFTPVGIGTLLSFGRSAYAEAWFDTHAAKFALAPR